MWNSVPEDSNNELMLWHRRLRHINFIDLKEAFKKGVIRSIDLKNTNSSSECDICLQEKMIHSTFPKHSNKEVDVLEIIHSDLFGSVQGESHGKSKYIVTFTDENTRWTEIQFLRNKMIY